VLGPGLGVRLARSCAWPPAAATGANIRSVVSSVMSRGRFSRSCRPGLRPLPTQRSSISCMAATMARMEVHVVRVGDFESRDPVTSRTSPAVSRGECAGQPSGADYVVELHRDTATILTRWATAAVSRTPRSEATVVRGFKTGSPPSDRPTR
jgi:hypothetical protein